MYGAIDIGGSKTLVASLTDTGVIRDKVKFETPKDYDEFLVALRAAVSSLGDVDFRSGGAGLAGTLDRKHGRAVWMGNLPWRGAPVQSDFEKIMGCPIVIENDAKMAGLSESMMVGDEFSRLLYVTVSTGIGFALVVDHKIDPNIGDAGGKTMLVEHNGKLVPWESFASGKAIVRRYGKKAQDIEDEVTWRKIVRDLRVGLIELIAVMQPEIVVMGGSVGHYFERWGHLLKAELAPLATPLQPIPVIREAARPDDAVIYGCYDLARATYDKNGKKRKLADAKVG